MDALTAYEFLKASLEQMPESERKKLSGMIHSGYEDTIPKRKKKPYDPVMSKAKMKRLLMKNHFKSRV